MTAANVNAMRLVTRPQHRPPTKAFLRSETEMPTLTVITAVHPDKAAHLGALAASIREQQLPPTWQLEWRVQEDGEMVTVDRFLPRGVFSPAECIVAANGSQWGSAASRNLGIAPSSGEIVRNADADDILPPGALARDVELLSSHPHVGWVTSAAIDFDGDAPPSVETDHHRDNPPQGPIDGLWLRETWKARGVPPVHPATLAVRRPLVMALGGWRALPGSADTALLVALSCISPGYFLESLGLYYRRWEHQTTNTPLHDDPVIKSRRLTFIEEQASALLATPWGKSLLTRDA